MSPDNLAFRIEHRRDDFKKVTEDVLYSIMDTTRSRKCWTEGVDKCKVGVEGVIHISIV